MRVCYLIQSHRDADQIARLVRVLGSASPDSLVIVAHDDTGCALTAGDLPCAAECHLLPVHGPLRRGYLSMLDPYLQAVAWLREQRLQYDWLVYLSGQDYPTMALAQSEAALAAADCDGFLRYWPALGDTGPWRRRRQGRNRYFFQYRDATSWPAPLLRLARAANGLQSLLHVHLVYGPRVGVRAWRTPFSADRACYVGWQWTTLKRECAELVLDRVKRDRQLVAYYERTICPDESLVQTVLVHAGGLRLTNDNLRYSDNLGSRDGRPRTLGVADFAQLTSGAFHFARKFDRAFDSRILDLLDAHLAAPTAAGRPG
jgi:hypothetical protein